MSAILKNTLIKNSKIRPWSQNDDIIGLKPKFCFSTKKNRYNFDIPFVIRRASDNAETNVIFDSSGNIRNGSLVTNGQTLLEWSESSNVYVTSWNESENSYNAIQAIALYQPQLIFHETNQAYLKFDGLKSLIADITDYTTPSTVFLVYKSDAVQTNGTSVFSSNVSAMSDDVYRIRYSADRLQLQFNKSGAGAIVVEYLEAGANQNLTLVTLQFDGIDKIVSYKDGTQYLDYTAVEGFLCEYLKYCIGSFDATGAFDGKIYEIIGYDYFLSDIERGIIETNIINHYGI